MRTWRKMEELVDRGLVRHIGTSNMTIPKMKLVLRDARIKPAVNEMELHPHFQQPEFFQYLLENGIAAHRLFADRLAGRPERDRTPEDTSPTEDPVIVEIAARLWRSSRRWSASSGQCSAARRRFRFPPIGAIISPTCAACVDEPLTAEDMRAIRAIDRNCRLIKGQVFLWKDDQSWEDLWDVHGEITPP